MIIAGKCPPEKEELEAAKERGFNNVELYLEKQHIDKFEKSLENCREAEVEIVSVHTPHVTLGESGYFEQASGLAEQLDAVLVFHSQYTHHTHIPELEKLSIESDYGYENQPGISAYGLENQILNRSLDIVLDTAHLFMAEKEFQKALDHFVKHRSEQIKVIHVNDSTTIKDGLAFGEGEMNMEKTCRSIADSKYDGIIVLEVMPDHQEDALQKWEQYTQ